MKTLAAITLIATLTLTGVIGAVAHKTLSAVKKQSKDQSKERPDEGN